MSASATSVSMEPVRKMLADNAARGVEFPSLLEVDAAAPLVQYEINVTNTGMGSHLG